MQNGKRFMIEALMAMHKKSCFDEAAF